MPYELHYWPTIQGRGEFVRLALEHAGAAYIDVARKRGAWALERLLADQDQPHPPFAVPALRDGDVVIAQTAAILLYLANRHGLAPEDEAGRLWTHQIPVAIADLVQEGHDTHHPVGARLYYEGQRGGGGGGAPGGPRGG